MTGRGLWSPPPELSPNGRAALQNPCPPLATGTIAGSGASPNCLGKEAQRTRVGPMPPKPHPTPGGRKVLAPPPLCRGPHGWRGAPWAPGGHGSAHYRPEEKGSEGDLRNRGSHGTSPLGAGRPELPGRGSTSRCHHRVAFCGMMLSDKSRRHRFSSNVVSELYLPSGLSLGPHLPPSYHPHTPRSRHSSLS